MNYMNHGDKHARSRARSRVVAQVFIVFMSLDAHAQPVTTAHARCCLAIAYCISSCCAVTMMTIHVYDSLLYIGWLGPVRLYIG